MRKTADVEILVKPQLNVTLPRHIALRDIHISLLIYIIIQLVVCAAPARFVERTPLTDVNALPLLRLPLSGSHQAISSHSTSMRPSRIQKVFCAPSPPPEC